MKYDILIVGAGLSGCVLAERYANIKNSKVLLIDKRNHIGGNCYDEYNKDGILVSKYGAHLFHTNLEDVWSYVNKFAEWYPYVHKVLSRVDGRLVPIPVNINTVNLLLGENISSEEEMKEWLKTKVVGKPEEARNSEESALSRVGEVLYEKLFKNYTKKQWDLWPADLDSSVMNRIPVRTNHDDRYFSDRYQALPKGGYAEFFKKIVNHPNIRVKLNTDFFNIKDPLTKYAKIFYTGPIDSYFQNKYLPLQYRSIKFEFETINTKYFQPNSVINYPNTESFTRIVEFKHMTLQNHPKTTICREYSTWKGEPIYPVPSQKNIDTYALYKKEAEKIEKEGVYFVGRLANYKYFNMDQAIKNALDLFDKLNNT